MRTLVVLLVLLLPKVVIAASGSLVVITSNSADFTAGTIIDRTQTIDLAPGESMKLVSSSGKIIDLQGPYSGKVVIDSKPADRSVLKSVSELVKNSRPIDFTLAIFRNPPSNDVVERPDIWGIDIRDSGTYCLRSDQPVYLWWPRSLPGKEITLSNERDMQVAQIKWPNHKKYHPWPDVVELRENIEYSVEGDQDTPKVSFTVRFLPSRDETSIQKIAWMTDRNCSVQATRLLAAVLNKAQ